MPTELPERRPDSVQPPDLPSGDQPFGGPVAPAGPDAVNGGAPGKNGPGSTPDLNPGADPAEVPAGASF